MASLFASRKKPRQIGRDAGREQNDEDDTGPVVVRPTTNAPKTKSKLRVSFNPGDNEAEYDTELSVVRPAKTKPGRNAISRPLPESSSSIPDSDSVRPAYSKDYLTELRNSTPSTPQANASYTSSEADLEDEAALNALEIASKFGNTSLVSQSPGGPSQSQSRSQSHIPTDAEIREKKARRARLAAQASAGVDSHGEAVDGAQEYISLDPEDDGEFRDQRLHSQNNNSGSSNTMALWRAQESEKDTRLVRDDEDIAEGFEEYVEDAGSRQVLMGRRAKKAAERQEREQLRQMIEEAEEEQGTDEEMSDSEVERMEEYEEAQTRKGMDGMGRGARGRNSNGNSNIPGSGRRKDRPPTVVTPIPKLGDELKRLKAVVRGWEDRRQFVERRQKQLDGELVEVEKRQVEIQRLLQETGARYQELRAEVELDGTTGREGQNVLRERGLENMAGR